MRLFSIKDGYLFKSDQPDGSHTYAVWYDKKSKRYCAVQTTHLYKTDQKRKRQLEAGSLIRQKFPGILLPSGVRNFAYVTDANGNKINIKDKRISPMSNKHLPKNIADKIKKHASGRFTSGKKKKSRK